MFRPWFILAQPVVSETEVILLPAEAVESNRSRPKTAVRTNNVG